MKLIQIKEKLQHLKVFSLNDVYLADPDFRQATLYDWEKIGYVKKIRNKWYYFSDNIPADIDLYLVANRIYSPSYVSMQLALNHYGVIPESVQTITSVTTLKTNEFSADLGVFSYQNIKENLFFGYQILEKDNQGMKIASIEKAILDFFYLEPRIENKDDLDELRFNTDVLAESLDSQKLRTFSQIFGNNRVEKLVTILVRKLHDADN